MIDTILLQTQGGAVALILASIELVVSRALTFYAVVYTNKPPRSTDRTTAVFPKDAHEGKPRPSTMTESCGQHRCNTMIVDVERNRTDRVTSAAITGTSCANSATPSAVNGNGVDGGTTALY
jgi:hypothetical protein